MSDVQKIEVVHQILLRVRQIGLVILQAGRLLGRCRKRLIRQYRAGSVGTFAEEAAPPPHRHLAPRLINLPIRSTRPQMSDRKATPPTDRTRT